MLRMNIVLLCACKSSPYTKYYVNWMWHYITMLLIANTMFAHLPMAMS